MPFGVFGLEVLEEGYGLLGRVVMVKGRLRAPWRVIASVEDVVGRPAGTVSIESMFLHAVSPLSRLSKTPTAPNSVGGLGCNKRPRPQTAKPAADENHLMGY